MKCEVTTIVLAAGNSKRFQKQTSLPKQFLRFQLQEGARHLQMWENVLECATRVSRRVLVVRYDHMEYLYGTQSIELVGLEDTGGQAESLLLAINDLKERELPMEDLLVLNCDAGFKLGVLDRLVVTGRHEKTPAAVTFQVNSSEEKRFSFTDGHHWFQRAAEKVMITENALAGAYYFPDWYELRQALLNTIQESRTNSEEPYISRAFGWMPGSKLSVRIDRESWWDWGTPECYNSFLLRGSQPWNIGE